MKYLLIFSVFFSLCFAGTKVAVLEISGMTCPLCTTAIKHSLKNTRGVSKTKVTLNTKKAVVEYDDTLASKKDLLGAVKKAGYRAKIVSISNR